MWLTNVTAGIIANFATVAVTVAAGALLLAVRRRALLRFWGIEEVKRIRIYISHLRITPGGALDAHGNPRSYQGSVVTQLESEMAALLRALFFAPLPGGAVQPGWVKALLFINADVTVLPAPGTTAGIDPDGTVVSFGSPVYNTVSEAIEQNCQSPVRFDVANMAIELPGNLKSSDPHQCVVARLRAGGRFWFYAAGLNEAGTAAAAHYLVNAWRRLDRLYRRSPSFYVFLEISGDDFRNSRVISEGALDDL